MSRRNLSRMNRLSREVPLATSEQAIRCFTLEQAARTLQVHPRLVRAAIREGSLRASRLGRLYRITAQDLQIYLDRQVVTTGGA